MNDRQQLAALGEEMAGRDMDLFEQKSPHQLAVELVAMQDRCDAVASEFSENARQCGAMAELLDELRPCLVDAWASDGHASRHDQYHNELLERIDALLAGKVPEPAQVVPEGWQLVPVEPVFEMLAADGCNEHHEGQECIHHKNRSRIWKAMLAAAPKPQGGE